MAEAFLAKYGGDRFDAESAGIEPGIMNANVVSVMREIGIDLGQKATQSVFDVFKAGRSYHAVITVCDKEAAERCPVFPGIVKRIPWSFKDPSAFKGTREEILQLTREVRDEIETKIKDFIQEASQVIYWV